jgi:DNA-binding LytR/AlgR family response regulator
MTCLIIDDNAVARTALRHFISDIDSLDLRGECEDAVQAIKYLQQQSVDLLFLDVEMPHMSGLELLQVLPQKPLVILVTSKRDYAVEAFDLQVVDYLVKPITLARLLSAVQRAQEVHQNKNRPLTAGPGLDEEHIFFKANNSLVRVQLNDILFFQALGDYVTLSTKDKRYTLYTKMKTIEDRLPVTRFIRTHRSYIVAIGKIDNIEDNSIQIGRQLIPISDSYRARVMAQLNFL